MKKYDWKNEYNPIRRTAKRLLSGEALTDGRPLSDLIELDEHTRKCLAFEATLTDRQIDMLQELGYLPVIMRQYGEECANCPYTLDEREHVRVIADEFANIGQIPQFDKLIATIRSREISASIILQSQSQLKAMYKDSADTILGNCDKGTVLSSP